MPVVSWSGRKYLDDKDQSRFTDLFTRVAESYPDQTRRYDQYETLRGDVATVNKFLRLQENIGIKDAWVSNRTLAEMRRLSDQTTKWLEEFHEDPDFTFVAYLDRGITGALCKRRQIRRLFRHLGSQAPNGTSYDLFFTGEDAVLRGYIRDVIPARFSVNLVVEDSVFNQHLAKHEEEYPSSVNGFHIGNTIFNLIRASRAFLSPEKKNMIIAHEDFHSLAEAFNLYLPGDKPVFSNNWRKNEHKRRLPLIQRHFDALGDYYTNGSAEEQQQSQQLSPLLRNLRMALDDLQDAGYEELMAELISEPYEKVPSKTFAGFAYEKQNDVLSRIIYNDSTGWSLIHKFSGLISSSAVNHRVKEVYSRVRRGSPNRIDHLGVAFALFPPSQFRHIQHLVDRWCSVRD